MADPSAELHRALVGRYLIERELGQGGMATVYLAADLKHPRKVAIKVLRADLAAVVGAERFVQEIRVLAALQHPHILGLIDSGIIDGARGSIPYYVMPYVEGESLRAKLRRETQLPVGTAIAIATAVASALDYAHRHGVIHRDIKPENILLHEDQALVADFGIALAVQTAGGPRLTDTGLALGTPQYMSPEQGLAEREIGPRSDVYAMGCVVYEMLAGEPPFTGPTAQAIVAKAARDTPQPLRVGRPSVPASVEAAVARALERLPADRFGSAGEFAAALTDVTILSAGGVSARLAGAGAQSWSMRVLALAVLGAFAGGMAVGFAARPSQSAPVQRVTRFEITLPPDIPSRENLARRIALAPDGSSMVYLGITDGVRHLFVRRLDQATAQPLPGTEGASAPFYSPDGAWVGFIAGSEMKKVPLGGGPPVRITNWSGVVTGASWGDRGDIVFASGKDRGMWRVSASGGTPELVIGPDSTRPFLEFPDFLPGGENVLVGFFTGIGVVNIRTGGITSLALPGFWSHYAGNELLVFEGENGLEAVPFDTQGLQVRGASRRLQIFGASMISGRQVAVSREGTLIYIARKDTEEVELVLVDRRGVAVRLADKPARFGQPRLSPDGRLVAVVVDQADGADLWTYSMARSSARRLTFDTRSSNPAWSADGTMVTYTNGKFMSTRADGAGSPQPIPMRPVREMLLAPAWSPDGDLIASSKTGDIWRIPTDSTRSPQPLIQTASLEYDGSVSPDGRWLAYTSNETGQWEVWVREYPSMEGRTMVSVDGGLMPVWDRSGKELYYRNGNRLYSAMIAPGAAFSVSERTVLFDAPQLRSAHLERDYDVSPDGKHFVMLRRADPLERLQVILHWDREFPPDK